MSRPPPKLPSAAEINDPGADMNAPWQVIVMNNNHNTFDGVAHALAQCCPGSASTGMAFRTGSTRAAGRSSRRATRNRPALPVAAQGPWPHDGPAQPRVVLSGPGACCWRSRTRGSSARSPRRAPDRLRDPLRLLLPAPQSELPGEPTRALRSRLGSALRGTMSSRTTSPVEEEGEHGAEPTETHGTETGEEPPASSGETTTTSPTEPAGTQRPTKPSSRRRGQGCHTLEAAGSSGDVRRTLMKRSPTSISSSIRSRTASTGCRRSRGGERSRSRTFRPTSSRRRRLTPRTPRIPLPAREVSERPKERDWKSRKRRKTCRGFQSALSVAVVSSRSRPRPARGQVLGWRTSAASFSE